MLDASGLIQVIECFVLGSELDNPQPGQPSQSINSDHQTNKNRNRSNIKYQVEIICMYIIYLSCI